METFVLKPSPGASVRDPVTLELLKDNEGKGEQKPRSNYWMRRVADGTAIIVVQPVEKTK